MIGRLSRLLPLLALLLAACGVPPHDSEVDRRAVEELTQTIRALGPEVDPLEAERVAHLSVRRARELAVEWQVTDPPLVHNTKVNLGLRPAGLCYQWADAIEARLRQEGGFETLELHRAIANFGNAFRIDHSTLIVSRRGDTMHEGVVLDGWRDSGKLFFAPVSEDTRYVWVPREEVFALQRRSAAARDRFSPSN